MTCVHVGSRTSLVFLPLLARTILLCSAYKHSVNLLNNTDFYNKLASAVKFKYFNVKHYFIIIHGFCIVCIQFKISVSFVFYSEISR